MDSPSDRGARTLPSPDELRAQRRAARAADNRADILDAAERAFAERGLDGSLRDIAKLAGFSTAGIYNDFENKQQLFAETLSRRGIELLDVIERSAASADRPMAKHHAIVDGAVEFTRSVALMVGIIEDGQAAGEIRDGSAAALLHFYMTLVYEHVFLATPENPAPALTRDQFHEMVDGALRATRA